MVQWLNWLREVPAKGSCALVSVLASEGSAPRGPGTRMVVSADALHGTIGGGQLEYRTIEQARAILGYPAGTWRVQDYPLGPLLGQCCGGRVRLLVEHVDPDALGWLRDAEPGRMLATTLGAGGIVREILEKATPSTISARGARPGEGACLIEPVGPRPRPVYLFGAGHVGQAIARHARGLPFQLAWFDTRPEQEAIDGVTMVDEDRVEACLADAPDDAAVLILTHDHGLDYRLTLAALRRGPLAFVGLIGSATKGARFRSRLTRDGIARERLAALTSPIGLPGVRGKEPDVIAIATLAQILQLRDI